MEVRQLTLAVYWAMRQLAVASYRGGKATYCSPFSLGESSSLPNLPMNSTYLSTRPLVLVWETTHQTLNDIPDQ